MSTGAEKGPSTSGLVARLLSHERQLQDRNSQLIVPDKNFKRVLDLLAITQRTAQRSGQAPEQASDSQRHKSSTQQAGSLSRAARDTRVRMFNNILLKNCYHDVFNDKRSPSRLADFMIFVPMQCIACFPLRCAHTHTPLHQPEL